VIVRPSSVIGSQPTISLARAIAACALFTWSSFPLIVWTAAACCKCSITSPASRRDFSHSSDFCRSVESFGLRLLG
jgi:hypothetical protein